MVELASIYLDDQHRKTRMMISKVLKQRALAVTTDVYVTARTRYADGCGRWTTAEEVYPKGENSVTHRKHSVIIYHKHCVGPFIIYGSMLAWASAFHGLINRTSETFRAADHHSAWF